MQHRSLKLASYAFVIIGALNWGIIGVLDVNVISLLLGGSPVIEKVLYILIGASALYDIAIVHNGYKVYGRKKK